LTLQGVAMFSIVICVKGFTAIITLRVGEAISSYVVFFLLRYSVVECAAHESSDTVCHSTILSESLVQTEAPLIRNMLFIDPRHKGMWRIRFLTFLRCILNPS
jgi:hypothetical protein